MEIEIYSHTLQDYMKHQRWLIQKWTSDKDCVKSDNQELYSEMTNFDFAEIVQLQGKHKNDKNKQLRCLFVSTQYGNKWCDVINDIIEVFGSVGRNYKPI